MSTPATSLKTESERYFLVGPDKKVVAVHPALFEAVVRYTKPNRKFARVEIVFKNGNVCDITCTEHLIANS